MRFCIYTAIFGDYDALLLPATQTVQCDFLCFTESALPRQVGPWRVIRTNLNPHLPSRMRSRYVKVNSHKIFPGGRLAWRFDPFGRRPTYDVIIWVDGCLRIKYADFATEFASHIGSSGWAMFVHPDRDCIYDEMPEAAAQRKCWGLPLAEQVAAYRAEGHPEHGGLMASTLIARDPKNQQVARTNEMWWAEMLKWSNRDQISLPVVLRRLGHDYDKVRLNLWDNHWFDRLEHNSDL